MLPRITDFQTFDEERPREKGQSVLTHQTYMNYKLVFYVRIDKRNEMKQIIVFD